MFGVAVCLVAVFLDNADSPVSCRELCTNKFVQVVLIGFMTLTPMALIAHFFI